MISDDDLRDHFERQYAQGGPTADTARAVLDLMDERDVTFQEFGELDEDTLERFARAYDGHEQQSFALQELCVEAGLSALNDHETDPIPLIRMFLPIEGD